MSKPCYLEEKQVATWKDRKAGKNLSAWIDRVIRTSLSGRIVRPVQELDISKDREAATQNLHQEKLQRLVKTSLHDRIDRLVKTPLPGRMVVTADPGK